MGTTLSTRDARAMLKAIGFDNAGRSFTVAVRGFQRGWNLGDALEPDADLGPLTSDALRISFARHLQGLPTMSAHFSYVEFRCKCGGAFASCERIWELRTEVRRLESYRAKIGGPVRVISGCRCKGRNQAVGGATASQHLFGAAADIEAKVTVETRRRFRLFAGLGFQSSTRKVVHVDSRDVSGHNTTGGKPTAPTEWQYAT